MPRYLALSKNLRSVAAACCLVLLLGSVAEACPNCKNGISGEDARNIAAGYYYSILFMLSMPALIITSFSGWMYLAVRRARAEREQQQDSSPESAEASSKAQES